jgi:2-C-methyl-D-erythritol 4-phosphate cytidylyltransferase/2-C-methyl-D-erythritol 2,4-cyclodiphosphate synthase
MGPRDKLWAPLAGQVPLWKASFAAFRSHTKIAEVGVACRAGDEHLFQGAGADFVVAGGGDRRTSSLAALSAATGEYALVHDAARPGVSSFLIDRVIEAMLTHGAAIPCVPIHDTLKRGTATVEASMDRSGVWGAQTPQGARRDVLMRALEACPGATDESMALESAGVSVAIVESDRGNDKVTTYADYAAVVGRALLRPSFGIGYDIHRFSSDAERTLVLGGVRFEGERGLDGHSDADVLLHAITDAVLGAAGEPDIGRLFPNDDPRWKGANSRVFLQEAGRRIRERGGEIGNVDATVIAERPKVAPRAAEMVSLIAKELGISESKVSVKATTNEGIGAVGRGEGIAAQAVASVFLPEVLESEA